MQDKELMILPLISGVIILAALAVIAVGFGISGVELEERSPAMYIPVFVIYVVSYAIGIFFQAAVIAGATERMRGGDPTVGSALAAAAKRAGPILLWAVVAATVGTLLKIIHDRVGFLGRIIAGLIGAAWSLATFFVVPVIVLEDHSVAESFKRSLGVFTQTWGESFVGGLSLGVAALCAWVTLVALTGLLAYVIGIAAVGFFVLGAVFLVVLFNTLNGIFVASLYRYATEGQTPAGFDQSLLANAFIEKRR
jgi:hypothetical protein